MGAGTVLALSGADVDALLDPVSCIAAVEAAFRAQGGADPAPPSGVLGMHAAGGGFHVKAAATSGWRYFAAKINANFPDNPGRHGLPTIQGVVVLFDGLKGTPRAIIDSVRITALRTAAASAVAAKFLARSDAKRLFVVGCGTQALAHVDAIRAVRRLEQVYLYDLRPERVSALLPLLADRGIRAQPAASLLDARESDMIVTCTPSRAAFLGPEHVGPGVFVAAVGADNEHKQEIAPALMRHARVVPDSREQCLVMGDTRGAVAAGAMTAADFYADLAEIVSGQRPGRVSADDVFVFDSTGVALEDVAAAGAVYERAMRDGVGTLVNFGAAPDAPLGPANGVLERYRFIR